jgi:hypothetical protein
MFAETLVLASSVKSFWRMLEASDWRKLVRDLPELCLLAPPAYPFPVT